MKTHYALITCMNIFLVNAVFACDLCAINNSIDQQKTASGSARIAITEQFTEYGRLQKDGRYFKNSEQQRLVSSITKIVGSYDFSESLSIQADLPYINRQYTRTGHDTLMQRGTEAGIGDITIFGRYTAYKKQDDDSYFALQLLGGIKLPTGDSDQLRDEHGGESSHESDTKSGAESHVDEAHHDHIESSTPDIHLHHGGGSHGDSSAAIHGHDLALGSGSFDYPLGISLFAESGRSFIKGSAIYTVRTEGDHDYTFADDFMWDVGPGYLLYADGEKNIAARIVLSGENKSKDSGEDGAIQRDTGFTSLFLGPEIHLNFSNSFGVECSLDMPLDINNSGTQVVADYRIRAGISYRF